MKKVILIILCGVLLTACCPSMDRIVGIIDNLLVRHTVTPEATQTVRITAVVTPTYTPTPECTLQPTMTPVPSITREPSADHRFIVTKLPP